MQRVWVDTDVALGARWGDVDDGFALAALLRCPSVEILGISTVFGNTTPEVAARCAREILSAACRHLTAGYAALRRLQRSPDPLAKHLARHSWRWLAYAPLRYGALEFPVWDLVPALDVCGLLDARFDLRRLRCEGRGLLLPDG